MPRQPYLQVVPRPSGVKYNIGTQCIGQRPELEKLIWACLMSWPFIEAEMAVLLAQILGAENEATLAVFQSLRRSSAQREAISAAAAASLNEADQELVGAVLNVHKSTEAERNALVHGHFGTASNLPDALIWQNTADYIAFRAEMKVSANWSWDNAKFQKLVSSIWVYRKDDLERTLTDIAELSQIWNDLTEYVKLARLMSEPARGQAYSRLCGQSRVARELENIRRKNNPSTPSR